MNLTNEEFLELSRKLDAHHAVFYKLWELGKPVFTDEIPTAAIMFDKTDGEAVAFCFNPKHWKESSEYERLFTICHECLHVILNHGRRIQGFPSLNMPAANIALDVVVNHMLVDKFGFERDKLDKPDNLCWIDTVFKGRDDIKRHETFEYYFKELVKNAIPVNVCLCDVHGLEDTGDIIDELDELLSDEDKELLRDSIEKHGESKKAGTGTGGQWCFAKVGKVAQKKKWETVIKKWSLQFTVDIREIEQWARLHRRRAMLPEDFMLPSEMEDDDREDPGKILVWFFQDTSGSCSGFRDRFFKAAMSLPTWRFDIKLHCFDTKVFETTLEGKKLYGFGGTSFSCIERYIQEYIKEHEEEYPRACFIVTDGYGDKVSPQYPDRWHWFLSNSYKVYVPPKSPCYQLSDYE